MEKIIDNRMTLLGDDLKEEITSGSKVRIAASCFTLFAFNELREELSHIKELELIFTEPTFASGDYIQDAGKKEKREFYIPKRERESSIFGTDFEIRLRNKMSLKAIAKECAKWVEEKVKFSSNITNANMQNFITIEQANGRKISYAPTPAEFSASSLGCEKSNDMFIGTMKSDTEHLASFYLKQFDEVWNDSAKVEDVTAEVVASITSAYKENSPEFIYFIILYNIFTEFLDDINEDNMPNELTGFKDTKLWSMLYDFQRDGVISIINKIEKHNGCVLADSVGLGKTFTALAVILYYTLRNKSVLVLCPKRLAENWTQYTNNDTTNIFFEDKLRYDVLYHTDLGRSGFANNGRDLSLVNWGNYDLVVIDESHNFRNNNPEKDRETRYDFLVNKVIKAGVKTKVLMLSATPVNNRYNDLKNQLALAYAGDYAGFENSLDTKSNIATIFRNAQAVFNEWSKQPASERNNKDLVDGLSMDFKILLDSVTIARSRKNIEKYYNMSEIGKFPSRLPPQAIFPELTNLEDTISYKEIYLSIKSLSLAVYGMFDYVLDSRKAEYEKKFGVEIKQSGLTISGRNAGIKRLMTVNLLKRLESSVESFRLTMRGMLEQNLSQKKIIERHLSGDMVGNAMASKTVFNYEEFDQDEDGSLNLSKVDKGTEVAISYNDIDCITWKNALDEDIKILEMLLFEMDKITPEHDEKLNTLKHLIAEKQANPINEGNKKMLIFSAFADTTNYLYNNISAWVKDTFNLETAMIEGGGNKATLKYCNKHTNHLLTMFSPISKNREGAFAGIKEWAKIYADPSLQNRISNKIDRHANDDSFKDIDVLIATDCISEGQNLQDCDICINYDIHWNPVRIVQRFGRIDRIGSKNDKIQLVNFWPPLPLNEYINLTDRVKSRMAIVDQTATADDNILSPNDQMDDYREVQIKRLQSGENIDLEDTSGGISISDLGLNEFRMDATEYIKTYGEPVRVPKGLHAVIAQNESLGIVPGVIFVLKNYSNSVNIKSQNRLHPYYLVYLDKKGDVVNTHLEVKQILDLVRVSSKGKSQPIKALCDRFNRETDDGLKMDKYNELLSKAIGTIIEVKEQSDVMSLLAGDVDVLKGNKIKGLDDFELLAFMLVK